MENENSWRRDCISGARNITKPPPDTVSTTRHKQLGVNPSKSWEKKEKKTALSLLLQISQEKDIFLTSIKQEYLFLSFLTCYYWSPAGNGKCSLILTSAMQPTLRRASFSLTSNSVMLKPLSIKWNSLFDKFIKADSLPVWHTCHRYFPASGESQGKHSISLALTREIDQMHFPWIRHTSQSECSSLASSGVCYYV